MMHRFIAVTVLFLMTCVPLVYAQDEISPIPVPQNHLLCFLVEDIGEAVEARVKLFPRQLFPHRGRVGPRRPLFCVMTHKRVFDLLVNGEPVNQHALFADANIRLPDFNCYEYHTDQIPRFKVRTRDQFARQPVKTIRPVLLCPPARKLNEIVFEVEPKLFE